MDIGVLEVYFYTYTVYQRKYPEKKRMWKTQSNHALREKNKGISDIILENTQQTK